MTSKYDRLGDGGPLGSIAALGAATIILSFAEVESVVGPLPQMAHVEVAWWGATHGGRFHQAYALYWRRRGWLSRLMGWDERTALELELDEKHKPLTAHERSKGIVQRAQEFIAGAGENMRTARIFETTKPGPKPREGMAKEEIAKATGVTRHTLERAEQHMAAVDEFPDLAEKPQKTALREAAQQIRR